MDVEKDFLIRELEKKSENEQKLIIALCGVIRGILISITIIAIVIVISYFWSPQDYTENNLNSKNTIEGVD